MPAKVGSKPTIVTFSGVTSATFSISFSPLPAVGSMVICGGCFEGNGTTRVFSSITDNQGNGTYDSDVGTGSQGSTGGFACQGSAWPVKSAGTFTVTVTCTSSAATHGAMGAVEFIGRATQRIESKGTVSAFDITSNDLNPVTAVPPAKSKSAFVVATAGLITNFAAATITGATGCTNLYDQDATGSFPGFSMDWKQMATPLGADMQSVQFVHANIAQLTAGCAIIHVFGDELPPARVTPIWPNTSGVVRR